MKLFKALLLILFTCVEVVAQAQPKNYSVSFLEPKNNLLVHSPFRVKFAAEGMIVRFVGDMTIDSGHFHVLIDKDGVEQGVAIPFSDGFIHFGRGQEESELTLLPGKYKLTLQFADGAHTSYGKLMSETINVIVE